MLLKNCLNFFKDYHGGSYTTMTKKTEKNGFVKITRCVVRFVNYYNIKEIKNQNKQQAAAREFERVIIPHILKENINTKNILLSCYTTKKHKTKTSYFYNDIEITEDQYYTGLKEKKKNYNIDNIFIVKLCDVVNLGGLKYE